MRLGKKTWAYVSVGVSMVAKDADAYYTEQASPWRGGETRMDIVDTEFNWLYDFDCE